MSVTASVNATIKASKTLAKDLGSASFDPLKSLAYSFANGNLANEVNQVFTDKRTLAATTSEELDLSGGLTDVYGNSIAFTKIKALLVVADSTNGGNIEVGGAAANGFNDWVGAVGDYVSVPPGGTMLIVAPDLAGYAVTASTADLLKVNNTDASSGDYEIFVLGVE